jgi:hypothetical protein
MIKREAPFYSSVVETSSKYKHQLGDLAYIQKQNNSRVKNTTNHDESTEGVKVNNHVYRVKDPKAAGKQSFIIMKAKQEV